MKKNIFLLSIFFLFLPKLQSQDTSPLVIKKETVNTKINQGGLEEIVSYGDDFYHYDEFRNLIKEENVRLLSNNELVSHTGYENEYDGQRNIIKQSIQHFNPDVNLWINDGFIDLYYDDDNCLIDRVYYQNLINSNFGLQWNYINNDNCLPLHEEVYIAYPTDTMLFYKQFYEYLNDKITFTKKNTFTSINPNGPFQAIETTYNEQEEITYELEYDVSFGDTILRSETFHNYTFDYHDNGFLKSKNIEVFRRNLDPTNSNSDLVMVYQNDLEYDCQGSLVKEFVQNPLFVTANEYSIYFYEGKDNCFEFEEKLKMKIFPNPTSDLINISSPFFGSGNTIVRVFDIYGRIFFEELIESRIPEQSFDLRKFNLVTGNYIIQLVSDKYQINEKLLFVE